jgi:hypothetical protein
VVEAVEHGATPTTRVPMRGKRGPYRPRDKRLSYLINFRVDQELLARLDALARFGGATRSGFIEAALQAAVAEELLRKRGGSS